MTRYAPGQTIGGWLLDERLGGGAFGEVFLAHWPDDPGRPVALKLAITPEARALLAAEQALAGRIDHPAVVPVEQAVLDGEPPFLVLTYCSGGNLRQKLEREGRLPPEQAAHLLEQALDCLAAAHAAGVVHRDLKPENLLFDEAGRLRVADFGLGQVAPQERSLLLSCGAGSEGAAAAGTLDYMAPEQREGSGDQRVDLYALGVILFELLAGKRPDRNDRLADHVDLGQEAERFEKLYQGLCARVERRFQNVAAVQAALAARPPAPRVDEADGERAGEDLRLAIAMLLLLIFLVGLALAIAFTRGKPAGHGLWYDHPSPRTAQV